jgi:LmbE family N-acetylglucosaminyl deacetylase
MTTVAAGNCARFAARSTSSGGTPTSHWLRWERRFASLDLTSCPGLVVVAAHPDDETLGLGGMMAALTAAGVHVEVVLVSDGGAAYPTLSRLQRSRLERIRRFEFAKAASILGVDGTICLGLPDGEIAEHEAWLAEQLAAFLVQRPSGVWCAATWRGDGHPDHEGVGRAAWSAARRTGAVLLEYPIWMWHWALPDDFAVPWSRARSVPLTQSDIQRKRDAAECFRSQLMPPDGHGPAVLPPFVVRRLFAVGEVVLV